MHDDRLPDKQDWTKFLRGSSVLAGSQALSWIWCQVCQPHAADGFSGAPQRAVLVRMCAGFGGWARFGVHSIPWALNRKWRRVCNVVHNSLTLQAI